VNRESSLVTRAWFAVAAAALSYLVGGCSPQSALLAALVPDSVITTVLGNFEHVSDENRKRVAELERGARWEELARLADENLSKDRSNAEWWLIAGYARSQMQQYAAAAQAYREAVRLEPDSATAWNLLGEAYRAGGEPRRAVNALNNALLAVRDSPMTFYLLGESYSDLRRHADAAAAYRGALGLDARFPQAWFGLARAYRALGRTADAEDAQARLQKLDPRLARRLEEDNRSKDASR